MKIIDKEQAYAKALTKTLRAYERLITNPEKYAHKLADYGNCGSCAMCLAMLDTLDSCDLCPLYDCVDDSYYNLMRVLCSGTYDEIKIAAQERYDALLIIMEKNGWIYA
jgi:hypothetical protein